MTLNVRHADAATTATHTSDQPSSILIHAYNKIDMPYTHPTIENSAPSSLILIVFSIE